MKNGLRYFHVLILILFVISACNPPATEQAEKSPSADIKPMSIRNNYVPNTISAEAQKNLKAIYAMKAYDREFPTANDTTAWRKTHNDGELNKKEANDKVIEKFQATIKDDTLAGVAVVHIYPKDWKKSKKVFIYVHGGAYTMFSAHSTLTSAVPMCNATGLHIISINYKNPPFARWDEIQNQVVAVFKALLEQGYRMEDIAIFGDSAGGGLALSTILNLRDQGLGILAACVLLSPWADISDNGDTYHTLENTDPTLQFSKLLKSSAEAYAGELELTDPRVSPVYGDFSKGFSPTLITEGTKCVFLSNSVRTYQAIEAAGVEAKLDVYEGMWHVFQQSAMPETEVSYKKISTFVNKHLNK